MPDFVRKPLEGLFPLIPLSLHDDQEIDLEGVRHSIGLVAAGGAPGCIVFGSMGQMSSVSEREFDAVCDTAVDAGHRAGIAVVVGSTSSYQRESVRRARYAEQAGADGSMLAAPYALPLTPEWALRFFAEAAESLDGRMALMLYNYSPLNGLEITARMWDRLLDIPNIKAVKESNFALAHFDEVLLSIGDRGERVQRQRPGLLHASALGAAGATGIFSWAGPQDRNPVRRRVPKGKPQRPMGEGSFHRPAADVRLYPASPHAPHAQLRARLPQRRRRPRGGRGRGRPASPTAPCPKPPGPSWRTPPNPSGRWNPNCDRGSVLRIAAVLGNRSALTPRRDPGGVPR